MGDARARWRWRADAGVSRLLRTSSRDEFHARHRTIGGGSARCSRAASNIARKQNSNCRRHEGRVGFKPAADLSDGLDHVPARLPHLADQRKHIHFAQLALLDRWKRRNNSIHQAKGACIHVSQLMQAQVSEPVRPTPALQWVMIGEFCGCAASLLLCTRMTRRMNRKNVSGDSGTSARNISIACTALSDAAEPRSGQSVK